MITVILPGYSLRNKSWAEEVASTLADTHDARPIFWNHWTSPDQKFLPKEKASDVLDVIMDESANIVAKSIGTLVASFMIQADSEKFPRIIFCGIPLNDISEDEKEEIKKALKLVSEDKIICFQNEDDPHGTYEQVRGFVHAINSKIKVLSKERGDHEYPYYEEFEAFFQS